MRKDEGVFGFSCCYRRRRRRRRRKKRPLIDGEKGKKFPAVGGKNVEKGSVRLDFANLSISADDSFLLLSFTQSGTGFSGTEETRKKGRGDIKKK